MTTTKPITFKSTIDVELIDSMGDDAQIVSAARVSTHGNTFSRQIKPRGRYTRMLTDDELKLYNAQLKAIRDSGSDQVLTEEQKQADVQTLINYLMKHRHGTPFEHGAVTFFVNAPIFVWREWHRHRVMSYNEESARYKQLDPVFYLPPTDRPMFKVDGWKPGRPKFLTIDEEDARSGAAQHQGVTSEVRYSRLIDNLQTAYLLSYANYEDNLKMGFDPGLARDCLPVGIFSSCWVTCNPRSIMAFLSLRTHDEAAKFVSYPLYEIEQAARQVEAIFANLWPITYKAFCDNGRVGP